MQISNFSRTSRLGSVNILANFWSGPRAPPLSRAAAVGPGGRRRRRPAAGGRSSRKLQHRPSCPLAVPPVATEVTVTGGTDLLQWPHDTGLSLRVLEFCFIEKYVPVTNTVIIKFLRLPMTKSCQCQRLKT